MILGLK